MSNSYFQMPGWCYVGHIFFMKQMYVENIKSKQFKPSTGIHLKNKWLIRKTYLLLTIYLNRKMGI